MFNSFPNPKPDIGGMNIKSVQRGTTSQASGTSVSDIPISNVDPNNSIVTVNLLVATSSAANGCYKGEVTSATNLRLSRSGTTAAKTISWEVIEYEGIKSLQKGTATISSPGSINVTFNPIVLSKSFVIVSFLSSSTVNDGTALSMRYELTTETNLQISYSSGSASVNYQVVEFP